jgi:hypothetical protein
MAREDPQVNIRLSNEEHEILEAAGWVKRRGKTEIAKAAVLVAIARYRKEPTVQEALSARRAADRASQGKVTPIGSKAPKRRSSGKGS